MTFNDFINLLKQENEIIEIDEKLSPFFEISALSRKNLTKDNKVLLFNNVENCSGKVVTNIFSSKKRIDLALNHKNIKEIGEEIYIKKTDYFQKINGTLNSNTKNIDLTKLPGLKSYEKDGGRYFTLPCVVTKHPVTKIQNSGIYRLQLLDEKTLGMHWHTYKKGCNHFEEVKKCGMKYLETAVVLGTHPVNIIASALPFKDDFNEFSFYKNIYDNPIEMIKCKTVNLCVPKDSQVVIEGIVKVDDYKEEGPFFMHTGKYDKISLQPIFTATALYIKENAIIPQTVTGIPPAENSIMMSYLMKIFLYEIKEDIEEITDFFMPIEGVFNKILYLKLKKNISVENIFKKIKQQRLLKNFKTIIFFNDDVDFDNQAQIKSRKDKGKIIKMESILIIDTR